MKSPTQKWFCVWCVYVCGVKARKAWKSLLDDLSFHISQPQAAGTTSKDTIIKINYHSVVKLMHAVNLNIYLFSMCRFYLILNWPWGG